MAGVTQRTVYRLRRRVDEKLGRLPLAYFDRESRGDILSRVTNDIDNIAQTLQQSLTQLITALLHGDRRPDHDVLDQPAARRHLAPHRAPLDRRHGADREAARRSSSRPSGSGPGTLNGHVEEMHTGHAIVKAFGRQREAIEKFDEENEALYQATYKAQFISGTIQPAMNILANLNYVAICVIGGVQVANGTMSLGDVQAFIQYSRQFTMPIVQTASIMNVLQSAVASAERVFELLDEGEQVPETTTPREMGHVVGRVAFDKVSFRYLPDTPLLEDLDLVAEPGHTVAIVGPTGAGKTTLVNLLMRFYEIDGGRISIDGVDIRDLTRDGLRGIVRDGPPGRLAVRRDDPREHRLRSRGRDRGGDPRGRPRRARRPLRADPAGRLRHRARRRRDQRVRRARSSSSRSPAPSWRTREILILDEATSSVDTRTEVLIQRAMARLMQGRTSFVIAHRLSTIRDAELILVMDRGQILEQGTHAELLARGGFYHGLYASQFEEALEPAV